MSQGRTAWSAATSRGVAVVPTDGGDRCLDEWRARWLGAVEERGDRVVDAVDSPETVDAYT